MHMPRHINKHTNKYIYTYTYSYMFFKPNFKMTFQGVYNIQNKFLKTINYELLNVKECYPIKLYFLIKM